MTLAEAGPFGKTFIFDAIAKGDLRAQKGGAATIIAESEWKRFLNDLPDARDDR